MSFPDPLAKYNCKLWTLYRNQTKMTLEDGEKSDWLQTSGSEEQHSGDISEFSFLVLSFSFFFLLLLMATPLTYGSSQARI